MTPQLPNYSVALCTHNGETFIREQLESIFTQLFLPIEIVLSDDASTDATIDVAKTVISEFNQRSLDASAHIRLIILSNHKPLGVVKNFEQALKATSSEFVMLCDQDDIWEPTKSIELLEILRNNKHFQFVFSDAQLVDSRNVALKTTAFGALNISRKEISEMHAEELFNIFLRRNLATGATVMLKRELINTALPFPSSWVHDEWLAIVAAAMGAATFTTKRLTRYRQHSTNQIGLKRRGIRHHVGRLIFPRGDRNKILFERAKDLSEHPFVSTLDPDKQAKISEKLNHEIIRSSLPVNRFKRIIPVFQEAKLGRYRDYGLGMLDILRDIVQPE